LLDYASALWGKTLDEFERDVVLPYLAESQKAPTTLRELLSKEFGEDGDEEVLADPTAVTEVLEIESILSDILLSGEFRFVVAAPSIPEGV
jgi:hypothetical protein